MADRYAGENEKGIPVFVKSERVGPTVGAFLDPPPQNFYGIIGSRRTILEIGCGTSPVLAWNLKENDAWVGCDPGIWGGGGSIAVTRGEAKVDPKAELVAYSRTAEEVPSFKPDVMVMVAPNPRDIAEGKILPDLDQFLAKGKKQTFVVALDTRTVEAHGFRKSAQLEINDWMSKHGFRKSMMVPGEFKANSRDLGSKNLIGCWVRG